MTILYIITLFILITTPALAGTWLDDFSSEKTLEDEWLSIWGEAIWQIEDGILSGDWRKDRVRLPVLVKGLNFGWKNYICACRVKIIES